MIIYVIGYFISTSMIIMMIFNWLQGCHISKHFKEESYREDLGMSVAFGMIAGCFWPITLFIIYCMTGFAEHGIWKYK